MISARQMDKINLNLSLCLRLPNLKVSKISLLNFNLYLRLQEVLASLLSLRLHHKLALKKLGSLWFKLLNLKKKKKNQARLVLSGTVLLCKETIWSAGCPLDAKNKILHLFLCFLLTAANLSSVWSTHTTKLLPKGAKLYCNLPIESKTCCLPRGSKPMFFTERRSYIEFLGEF